MAGISYGSTLIVGLRHSHPERVLATLQLSPANDFDPAGLLTPVVRQDPDYFKALIEAERPLLDMFKVQTLDVLAEIQAWTIPGVASCDADFLDG